MSMRRSITKSSQEKRQYQDDAAVVDADKENAGTFEMQTFPMDGFTDLPCRWHSPHMCGDSQALNPKEYNFDLTVF